MVARLEEKLSSSAAALALFRVRLLEAGYVEDAEYDKINLQLVSRTDYEVSAAFPRLIRAGVPEAISDATYKLELDKLADFMAGSIRYDE